MSYFATTKCPKCGKTKQHHLGGLGFYTAENTQCPSCGYTYPSVPNCLDMNVDRADPPVRPKPLANVSTEELQKELERRLADFSTADLERELQRRQKNL